MDYLINIEQFPKYQYIIACIIAIYDIAGITFSYFQHQITTCCEKSDGLSHDGMRV